MHSCAGSGPGVFNIFNSTYQTCIRHVLPVLHMLIPMLNPIATLISTKQRWQRRRIVTRICQDMAIERQEKGSQMLPLNKHQQITGGVRVQCLLFYGNLALNLSLDSAGCWFCDVLWICMVYLIQFRDLLRRHWP